MLSADFRALSCAQSRPSDVERRACVCNDVDQELLWNNSNLVPKREKNRDLQDTFGFVSEPNPSCDLLGRRERINIRCTVVSGTLCSTSRVRRITGNRHIMGDTKPQNDSFPSDLSCAGATIVAGTSALFKATGRGNIIRSTEKALDEWRADRRQGSEQSTTGTYASAKDDDELGGQDETETSTRSLQSADGYVKPSAKLFKSNFDAWLSDDEYESDVTLQESHGERGGHLKSGGSLLLAGAAKTKGNANFGDVPCLRQISDISTAASDMY